MLGDDCLTVADPHLTIIGNSVVCLFEALLKDRKIIAWLSYEEPDHVAVALDQSRRGLRLSFPFPMRLRSGDLIMVPEQSDKDGSRAYPEMYVCESNDPGAWRAAGPLWTSGFRLPVTDLVMWESGVDDSYWVAFATGTSLRSQLMLGLLDRPGGCIRIRRRLGSTYSRWNARAVMYRLARGLNSRCRARPIPSAARFLLRGLDLRPDRPAGVYLDSATSSATLFLQGRGLWPGDTDIRQTYGRGVYAMPNVTGATKKFRPKDLEPFLLPSRLPGSWNELKTHTMSVLAKDGILYGATDGFAADGRWRLLLGCHDSF
jgi:hypothetical protein